MSPAPSFDAGVIGLVFASFLTGTMTVQVYMYAKSPHSARDGRAMYALVAFLWILDVTQLAFEADFVNKILRSKYTSAEELFTLDLPWTFYMLSLLSGMIASTVQLFYAWRVRVVSGRKWFIPTVIAILAFLALVFCITTVAVGFGLPTFVSLAADTWELDTWIAVQIAGDLVIVSTLVYYLQKGKSGMQQTDQLIDRLLLVVVNTGLLPTLAEIGHIIGFTVNPINFAYLFFLLVTAKLYANSFMATLNARSYIFKKPDVMQLTPVNLSRSTDPTVSNTIEINIDRHYTETTDEGYYKAQ